MEMFSEYIAELPPFKKYWEHLFEKKQMIVVASDSGAKVLAYADLRKELFHPCDSTNTATDNCLVELAGVAAQKFLMSCMIQRRQHISTCLSLGKNSHFLDARLKFRRLCVVLKLLMI